MSGEADTFIMVRTVCCEGYKQHGRRCEICPNRPENRQAVLHQSCGPGRLHGLGISHPSAKERSAGQSNYGAAEA